MPTGPFICSRPSAARSRVVEIADIFVEDLDKAYWAVHSIVQGAAGTIQTGKGNLTDGRHSPNGSDLVGTGTAKTGSNQIDRAQVSTADWISSSDDGGQLEGRRHHDRLQRLHWQVRIQPTVHDAC